MKKFLIKSVVFVLPLLIVGFYFELKLSGIPNSYTVKKQNFEARLDSIEVLVLGSSQATYDFNPQYFSLHGYNLSNISQSLFYDSRLTLKYIDKMPNLKYVMISVSYFTLGYEVIDFVESWRDYYYAQYWRIKYPEVKWHDVKNYSKTFLFTPKTSLAYFKKGFRVNLADGYDTYGWLKKDTVDNCKNISDSLGIERTKFHKKQYVFERVEGNKRELEYLMSELLKRKVTPVLITPPVYATYYNNTDAEIDKKNAEIIKALCTKYNCMYYDYTKDTRFEKRDFFDNDHLNFVGAEKFSKIVDEEILKDSSYFSSNQDGSKTIPQN